jgi:hypothetical protein
MSSSELIEVAMSFSSDNSAFEEWLRTQCCVVERDLEFKHERMKKNPFVFLRATFFRWAKKIEALCPELKDAPPVLSVGDTHLENFGTWRDDEGRLVWGVNDFDEAAIIPYPFDLVRLATSVRLAPGMKLSNRDAAAAILKGYGKGLAEPGPTLLDETQTWMRRFVTRFDDEGSKFWAEVEDYPKAKPPEPALQTLKLSLPKLATNVRFSSRVKGGGSLGRPRYVAVADWQGGRIVREAKALVPSAWDWAHDKRDPQSRFRDLAKARHRSPDPFLKVRNKFICRRIAPDSHKFDLGHHAGACVKLRLLEAMGFDLGSIHAAKESDVRAVCEDLQFHPSDWLYKAAKRAETVVKKDHAAWIKDRE